MATLTSASGSGSSPSCSEARMTGRSSGCREEDEDDLPVCKFCYEPDYHEALFYPCRCTSLPVHASCCAIWIEKRARHSSLVEEALLPLFDPLLRALDRQNDAYVGIHACEVCQSTYNREFLDAVAECSLTEHSCRNPLRTAQRASVCRFVVASVVLTLHVPLLVYLCGLPLFLASSQQRDPFEQRALVRFLIIELLIDTVCGKEMEAKYERANKYCELRESTNYVELRKLLADDFHFLGGRGEDIRSPDEFVAHLEKHKPSGSKWGEAQTDTDGKSVIMKRKMGVGFLTITIFIKFGFDSELRINFIQQGRM
ncbi:hypothetical protein FVE85_6076 [Porphyridium purpureum]|uniref:RING-CH-type domain-containing protein n=1 Tax=Porphyridium purpureum TaxID=35688 RepID=A0A5J4Z3S7_PORPP|nr:hypothetical protein FVE85_6076 [Porphyridium purpureum]|eukprot:POR2327..scf295_1